MKNTVKVGKKMWCSEQGDKPQLCKITIMEGLGFSSLVVISLNNKTLLCQKSSLFDLKEDAQKDLDQQLSEPQLKVLTKKTIAKKSVKRK